MGKTLRKVSKIPINEQTLLTDFNEIWCSHHALCVKEFAREIKWSYQIPINSCDIIWI
jgi:hypothetical protein